MNLEKFHFVTRFLEQVQKYQDREAVRFRKNGLWASISWKELDKNVRAIANALVFNKIEETENIGIFSLKKIRNFGELLWKVVQKVKLIL